MLSMIIISNYQNAKDISDKFVAMEGLMEKLPMNKKKATLLKSWKRRFFRAKDGWLYYYEVRWQFPNRPFPTGLSFQNTCKARSPLFHFQSSPFSKTYEINLHFDYLTKYLTEFCQRDQE